MAHEEVPWERGVSNESHINPGTIQVMENENDQHDEQRRAIEELMMLEIVKGLAWMEVLNPEVLRTTKACCAFHNRAGPLRIGKDGDFYHKSKKSQKISAFWSHSWHGGHWNKILTLIMIYNGLAAVILGMFSAVVMMVLFCFGTLPELDRGRTGEFPIGYSCWCLWIGVLVTSLVMVLWQSQTPVFLDRICISETDVNLKGDAIMSLAGLLKNSDEMLVLWDSTWTQRLWCLFELAAFLQIKKGHKKILRVRPTFLGPLSLAFFLLALAGMIPMVMAPMDVGRNNAAALLSTAILVFLIGAVAAYFAMKALRGYFRDLDTMKEQLQSVSFDAVRSACCDSNHVNPVSGEPIVCDRKILKECVKQWFGSQEAFESKVNSEIAEILSHDLERVFTTKSALAAFMPVMWAFMDLAATEWKVPYRDLWHFGSAAFLLDGLTIWLVICPLIKDGVVLVGKLTKARGSTPCWEVLKNLLLTAMFAIPAEIIQGIYIILFASSFPPVVRALLYLGCVLFFALLFHGFTQGLKAFTRSKK